MKTCLIVLFCAVQIACHNNGQTNAENKQEQRPVDSATSAQVPSNDDFPDEDPIVAEQQRTDRLTHMQDHLESQCHDIWGKERPVAQFDVEPDGTLSSYNVYIDNDALKACLMAAIEAARFNFGTLPGGEDARYVIPLTPH